MEIRPTLPFIETRLKGRDKFTVWPAGTRGHRDGKASHKHPEGQLIVVQDGLLIMSTERPFHICVERVVEVLLRNLLQWNEGTSAGIGKHYVQMAFLISDDCV